MGKFRFYLEDATQVLDRIKASPNMRAVEREPGFWDQYAQNWGVRGEFVETRLPTDFLVGLVERRLLHLSRFNEREVEAKLQSGSLNPVIISRNTHPNGPPAPLVALDGTHSLVAAARSQGKIAELSVVISRAAMDYLGLS